MIITTLGIGYSRDTLDYEDVIFNNKSQFKYLGTLETATNYIVVKLKKTPSGKPV